MGNSTSKPTFDPTKQPLQNDSTYPIQQYPRKASLLSRIQDRSLGSRTNYSDEDLKRYTGKSNDELKSWATNAPDVGRNQKAGKIGMGPGSGGAGAVGGDG